MTKKNPHAQHPVPPPSLFKPCPCLLSPLHAPLKLGERNLPPHTTSMPHHSILSRTPASENGKYSQKRRRHHSISTSTTTGERLPCDWLVERRTTSYSSLLIGWSTGV
ncbi:hypothetical protein E2C01_005913 [Portunus trituberculatus]|uniref:Uncharacterized protein n=1 Tax=Portunus trituberculatus TaxID=210409 RepID=A0A5B7CTX6_PORTR|nr:hypothetical protein [Portunus trituberculatus]